MENKQENVEASLNPCCNGIYLIIGPFPELKKPFES